MGGLVQHFVDRPFALESVSRRETAVQGQTAATSYRYALFKSKDNVLTIKEI